jgi:6-pyruvoyltetrahydropterin 2'-reductase
VKYLEAFYSLQGEGARVGVPSLFIRVAGCNLQCPGFGRGGDNTPIDYSRFKADKLEDVPVLSYGCDSFAAWNHNFKNLWKDISVDQIIELWEKYNRPDIVITGGEPLLPKYQKEWVDLIHKLDRLDSYSSSVLTFETNGTQMLSEDLINAIEYSTYVDVPIIFSVSVKLSNSGEKEKKRITPECIDLMADMVGGDSVYLKFVVGSDIENQLKEIIDIRERLFYNLDVYLMPEGATKEDVVAIQPLVADVCLREGYRFSTRLHNLIWDNNWGT